MRTAWELETHANREQKVVEIEQYGTMRGSIRDKGMHFNLAFAFAWTYYACSSATHGVFLHPTVSLRAYFGRLRSLFNIAVGKAGRLGEWRWEGYDNHLDIFCGFSVLFECPCNWGKGETSRVRGSSLKKK